MTMFPSPYGVSFILIPVESLLDAYGLSFRLLTEYHSFLLIVMKLSKEGEE